MTNTEILDIALAQSATNCCCAPKDFFSTENVVHASSVSENLPAYFELPMVCDLVSYGSNVVACCAAELVEPITAWLGGLDAVHDAFETPELYRLNELLAPLDARVQYQAEYFLPDVDALLAVERSCPFELRVLGPDDFRELYVPAWSNALCDKRPQLDVLGVGAYDAHTCGRSVSTCCPNIVGRASPRHSPTASHARPSGATRSPSTAPPGAT